MESDYAARLDAWRTEFSGREGSIEATAELAEIEERWGDSYFFGGEPGARAHYQAAQRALMPPGMMFSPGEESDRRMESYQRLTSKLYAVGPDDMARAGNDAQPHPRFKPVARTEERAPEPEPAPAKAERPEAATPPTSELPQIGLREIYRDGDHWHYHRLGDLWLDAAREMSIAYPVDAHTACHWSLHFYGLYNEAWTAHLPASRWDSDGGAEMMGVQSLAASLAAENRKAEMPVWASRMLQGDWEASLAVFSGGQVIPEFKTLALLLGDACQTQGQEKTAEFEAKLG